MYWAFLITIAAFLSFSITHFTVAANNTEPVENQSSSQIQNCNEVTSVCQTNPAANISAEIHQTPFEGVTSNSKSVLYDNFENGIYDLTNEASSPNGKWRSIDNGYGAMGVKTDDRGNNIFFLRPKAAETKNETFSALATTVNNYTDFALTLDVITDKQLRLNTRPNSWEAAWVLFRYTDIFHYYWLLVKPDGVELGKKDCNSCTDPIGGQVFLKRLDAPNLTFDRWSKWNIQALDNHIVVSIDGNRIIDYIDKNASETLANGSVGLYTEDADVAFDNIYISSRNSTDIF
jgi:hypothetical protein